MNLDLLIILSVLIFGFAITLYFQRTWITTRPKNDSALAQWLQSIQATLESTNKTLHEAMRGTSTDVTRALAENTRQLNERLDTAAKVIGDVQKNLGEMSEVGRGLKSLQEFLQSPKLRGGIGEEIMSQMIGQTFPKNAFHLQYSFKSGAKVDAVLKTDAGLLCIDSKFPLENFEAMAKGDDSAKKNFLSDVKKHISDISKKYILPEENTMDFALMYVPSEPIYYEVVNTPELMKFARLARVYPVSPSTFYAHLQVLLVSFQGKELEAKSREVFRLLRAIQKDYGQVEENLNTLGRHLTNAHNQMGNVSQTFNSLGQKLSRTETISTTDEPPQLET
jgi:DNA recombination protein RmuC